MRELGNELSGSKKQGDCFDSDCHKTANILYSIIDGESTKEEELFFKAHVDECKPCLQHYKIEDSIIQAVKEKLSKKTCPESIVSSIKNQIKNNF